MGTNYLNNKKKINEAIKGLTTKKKLKRDDIIVKTPREDFEKNSGDKITGDISKHDEIPIPVPRDPRKTDI